MSLSLRAQSSEKTLPKNLDHRVSLYSLAAVTAGVSMLALAQPAKGEVVVTRKTIPINPVTNEYTFVSIDLNHDGIRDFQFSLSDFQYHTDDARLAIFPLAGGAAVGAPGSKVPFYASALMRGARIGPSDNFSSNGFNQIERSFIPYIPSQYSRKLYGEWGGNPPNRYIGVRFPIKGATHYGWIRLSVDTTHYPMSATITAYAYETVPNKRILAGIDSTVATEGNPLRQVQGPVAPSLGMLALGADGLAFWRREETSR
jgi:hypothetical protein